jgi:hypothetical protein
MVSATGIIGLNGNLRDAFMPSFLYVFIILCSTCLVMDLPSSQAFLANAQGMVSEVNFQFQHKTGPNP